MSPLFKTWLVVRANPFLSRERPTIRRLGSDRWTWMILDVQYASHPVSLGIHACDTSHQIQSIDLETDFVCFELSCMQRIATAMIKMNLGLKYSLQQPMTV